MIYSHFTFENLPTLLPEFSFKLHNNCYISQSGHKIDGSKGKPGKVYIYKNNPTFLIDFTRGAILIKNYVAKYHQNINLDTHINHCPTARLFNYSPLIDKSSDYKQFTSIFNAIYHFSRLSLLNSNNEGYHYLVNIRKYSPHLISKMNIGYIPSKQLLANYLKQKLFSHCQISQTLDMLHYIGVSHKVIIPYHNPESKIIGFVGRSTSPSHVKSKYFCSKNLKKSSTLFNINNISPKQPIVITEGIFDALHFAATKSHNIIALGGTSLNQLQISLLQKLQPSEIVLILDNDTAGRLASSKILSNLLPSFPKILIKVVFPPSQLKDLDEWLLQHHI